MKAEERWQARFRAPRMTLPRWARQAPNRSVYRCNASGAWEIYAWDRAMATTRQVTDRPQGTAHGLIDPTGRWIWWFADTDGDEHGVWMRQLWTGGPDEVAHPGVPPGNPAGIGLSVGGAAAVGRSSPDGFQVLLVQPGSADEPVELYRHQEAAYVADLSLDGSLVAINHSEHRDARHPAIRVLRANGRPVANLCDGPDLGLTALRFAPLPGDRRLLCLHERRGRREPLVWDPVTGERREVWVKSPGDISADWYPDGRALLIVNNHRGRTELFRYDLAGGGMTPISTPHGVIEEAAARLDGTVEYSCSSAAHPPLIRSSNGQVVINPAGPIAPPSVPVEDIDVAVPGGRVHAMISRPGHLTPPYPTVVLLHGGPAAQDTDSFAPDVATWVDHGFAVVRVNYRGSTGYGTAWRDALRGDVGHIELADVTAVREWAVEHHIADPDRLLLAGASWGGFLTLLALGTQPKVWAAGSAAVPIADHAAAYEQEAEGLRAYHRALLGGSPEEIPDRYRSCSPITYADAVTAPLLVLAGENDPRCPIGQIDSYLEALRGRSHPYEVYRYDAGHGTLVMEERIRQMAAQLAFARKHVL